MGLRVSENEELEGLDIGEHGMSAYPDFQEVAEAGGSVSMSSEKAEQATGKVLKESEEST